MFEPPRIEFTVATNMGFTVGTVGNEITTYLNESGRLEPDASVYAEQVWRLNRKMPVFDNGIAKHRNWTVQYYIFQ